MRRVRVRSNLHCTHYVANRGQSIFREKSEYLQAIRRVILRCRVVRKAPGLHACAPHGTSPPNVLLLAASAMICQLCRLIAVAAVRLCSFWFH